MMNRMEDIPNGNRTHLSLSALRLLVPPIRLVSAAAWQTIQQKVVANYGVLEEFVSKVTDFVPELLTSRQRAQLTIGLRARFILEFCRFEATANFDVVQPHLDRIHTLIETWATDAGTTNMERPHFVDLVKDMLKDPDKREHFFQKVFPQQFGSTFDEALNTLMWLFLSRLEKFLPFQSFQQVASMFGEVSSVLEECMESVSQCEELRTLLRHQKIVSELDHNDGSLDDVCIISALKLPSVEGAETHRTQHNLLNDVVSHTTDLKEKSLTLSDTTERNIDTDLQTSKIETDKTDQTPGSNGPTVIFGDIMRYGKNVGHFQSQAEDATHLLKQCHVQLERLEVPLSLQFRPVRRNRGLRMKTILLNEKRGLRGEATPATKKAESPNWVPPANSDSEDSSSFRKTSSYMAPISNFSEDDSWSYYSEKDSCHKTTNSSPSMADSWSYYSDDASSFVTPVSSPTEDDSLSKCSNEDPSFMDPKTVSATSRNPGISDIKASTPKKIRKVQCFICKEHLTTVLKKHMKTHFPTGDYFCPRCNSRFKLLSSFKMHMRRTCYEYSQQQVDPEKLDKDKNLYKCDKCQEAFRYKISLDKHKVTHNELYCNVCRRVLRDAEMLARHKVSHTLFQCTRCEENFTHFLPLQKHFANIHKSTGLFKCNHCPKTLPRIRLLILHEWRHTGHLPFQCAQCNSRFRSDAELIHHQRIHTKEKPYLCSECGKTFSQNCNLLRHLNLVHKFHNEKRHSCSQCDKSFKEKGALKKHERSKHLRELFRHPCPFCGKMVASNTLSRHKLMHTGQRPFKCTVPECDKFFRSTSEVKRHVLFHHSTDRPYKCDVCGKGFIKKCFLTIHTKTHSGEKPFVCHICGKAFPKLYSMQRHKNLVHTFVPD